MAKKFASEHGDALCSDDKGYQRFRKIIQHPITKKIFTRALPIKNANKLRKIYAKSKTDNAKKSLQIMDVNEQAVRQALQKADILIHGHTHRPAVHQIGNKKRLVLGDWRLNDNSVNAVIGVTMSGQLNLVEFFYTVNR
ncbi:MAG: hypothetical protein U1E98_03670 [Moraxella osloensis]